jgi:hypothetical protein
MATYRVCVTVVSREVTAFDIDADDEAGAVARLYGAEDGSTGEDMPEGEVVDISSSKIDRSLEPYVELIAD